MHIPAVAAAAAPPTSSSVALLWVQVLKPDLALFRWSGLWVHCVVERLACFLGLASFCDFGSVKLKAHLRLAVLLKSNNLTDYSN